jgi:hypothetical protein
LDRNDVHRRTPDGASRGRVIALPNPEYYHEFRSEDVQNALEAARTAVAEQVQVATADVSTLDLSTAQVSEVTLQAACISVVVRNRKVCLSLPLGFGSVCLPIPLNIPDGTAASACLSIRTVWGFPTGVCVSVSALGNEIVRKCFP